LGLEIIDYYIDSFKLKYQAILRQEVAVLAPNRSDPINDHIQFVLSIDGVLNNFIEFRPNIEQILNDEPQLRPIYGQAGGK